MKLPGKIILAALFSLFIFALASPSEAWRGRGGHHVYKGQHRHYGHRAHLRQRGHYTGKRHYGKTYRIKRSYRHYRHESHLRHGHRGYRYGIHLGYGHGRYGLRTYYRYPHRSRYYYWFHRVNRYLDRGYPDHYRNDAFAKYLWEFDGLSWPTGFAYWPNLAI